MFWDCKYTNVFFTHNTPPRKSLSQLSNSLSNKAIIFIFFCIPPIAIFVLIFEIIAIRNYIYSKKKKVSDALIIIPTFCEEENIEKLVRSIFYLKTSFDILVIDDNSPDKTSEITENLTKEFPGRIYLLKRPSKLGLGTAYITGFNWALQNHYNFIFEMDADFSHNPNDLEPLLQAIQKNGVGMAVGSRYKKGVSIVHWPMGRLLLSYYASMYVRTVTGMNVRDATAGFVCYKRELLEKLNLDKINMKGYGFQIEMKFKSWKLGYEIEEVPVIFINRELGDSKMSGGIFSEAFMGVIRMKLSSLRRNYSEHISRGL